METWPIWNGDRLAGYIRRTDAGGYDWLGLWRTGKSQGTAPAFAAALSALQTGYGAIAAERPHLLIGPSR